MGWGQLQIRLAQACSERRKIRLDDVANDIYIDTEILVHEDIAESSDLRPSNLRVCVGEFSGRVVCRFSDDLKVPLDGVFRHVDEDRVVVVECLNVPLASFDRLLDVSDALFEASAHNATASAIAESEIGRLSS